MSRGGLIATAIAASSVCLVFGQSLTDEEAAALREKASLSQAYKEGARTVPPLGSSSAVGDVSWIKEPSLALRTHPGAWATEPILGVRWGMGPGDVRPVFPTLKWFFEVCPSTLATFIAKANLEDPVDVSFNFIDGHLYEVCALRSVPPETKETRYSFEWASIKAWRERIVEGLTEKYGKPNKAPSSEEIANAGEIREPWTVVWVWFVNDTWISLDHSLPGLARLCYMNSPEKRRAVAREEEFARGAKEARAAKF